MEKPLAIIIGFFIIGIFNSAALAFIPKAYAHKIHIPLSNHGCVIKRDAVICQAYVVNDYPETAKITFYPDKFNKKNCFLRPVDQHNYKLYTINLNRFNANEVDIIYRATSQNKKTLGCWFHFSLQGDDLVITSFEKGAACLVNRSKDLVVGVRS